MSVPASSSGPAGVAAGPGPASAAASAATEREQKMLDSAMENLSQRVGEVRGTIVQLLAKVETDPNLSWDSFLNSYSLVTSQLNTTIKTLKQERTPALKRYITLPLLLSPDRDDDLMKATENRVQTFSHDLVPDYLRTKPDPDVEAKHAQYESRASAISSDAMAKQLKVMEKITMETLKVINREKDDLTARDNARAEMDKTTSIEDTFNLVAAITNGKGLKDASPMAVGPGAGGPSGGPPPGARTGPMGPGQTGKAPSGIKTNIKAQVHPYQR